MDVRCGFIINNLQSSREKAFNARQVREQVNPKGLPILFFKPYSLAVTLSLLKKETRPHLKLESSLTLSYPSS